MSSTSIIAKITEIYDRNIEFDIKSTIKEKDSHKEKRQHQGYYMYPRCCRINFGFYSSTIVDKEPFFILKIRME